LLRTIIPIIVIIGIGGFKAEGRLQSP
jgi:hypothetical protein